MLHEDVKNTRLGSKCHFKSIDVLRLISENLNFLPGPFGRKHNKHSTPWDQQYHHERILFCAHFFGSYQFFWIRSEFSYNARVSVHRKTCVEILTAFIILSSLFSPPFSFFLSLCQTPTANQTLFCHFFSAFDSSALSRSSYYRETCRRQDGVMNLLDKSPCYFLHKPSFREIIE